MESTEQNLTVIPFQSKERTKKELNFDRSTEDLLDVMRELVLVEKATGRTGLPQRVCLAFNGVLMYATRLAEEETKARARRG